MSHVIYTYKIPNPARPIARKQEPSIGPSGELMPFNPVPPASSDVVGQQIDELSTLVGAYGMGGPGFFGLRLGANWLVIAIWGAGEWISADGRLVEDYFHQEHGRPKPWISKAQYGYDELSSKVVGHAVKSLDVEAHSLRISIADGPTLVIDQLPTNRPRFQGSDAPRLFSETDDLRRAVFLAPTDEIWV